MRINHVFLSITYNYPYSFNAANTKFAFLGKGFLERGDDVLVINKFYRSGIKAKEDGQKDGFRYVSLPDDRFDMLTNTLKVCSILKKSFNHDSLNVVYLGGGHFFILLFLTLYSRMLGYKVALVWDEYQAGLDFSFIYKLNGILLCYVLGYFVNFILPISEFLVRKSAKFRKPIFKLPICADFKSPMISESRKERPNYFLYCASVEYDKALQFVLDSYLCAMRNSSPIASLHVILSGNSQMIEEFQSKIRKEGIDDRVMVMTQLPYDVLIDEYQNAQALLIPLFSDRLGDVARFSQKISEYLSTRRPVISSNVGEIAYYFKNMDTMLIAESSDVEGYAAFMKFVIENPGEANIIGERGYCFGAENFDYRIISINLSNFLSKQVLCSMI